MAQLASAPAHDALVPPQNLEAEEHVLGAAMLSPAAITACREILSSDGLEFYRESHTRIWRAALRITDRGEPVDVITLTDELAQRGELEDAGGRGRLHELAALVPATANAAHYAKIVNETATLRGLIKLGGEISRLGWERPGEASDLVEQARTLAGELGHTTSKTVPLEAETWAQFERTATEHVPMLIDGLWPEAGVGVLGAPPKKGKTWVGLDLAISVATGTPFLAHFAVTAPQPVVLLACEGHRAAIRGRIGALAHGHGLNPHTDDLLRRNLHIVYKPAGINLADPAWIHTIRDLVQQTGAKLLIVDVLRAAAVMKENSNDEIGALFRTLTPLHHEGCAIALLHHFTKLSEISKERTPGERLSGGGAIQGAYDVGVFITKSDHGARELRLEFETRDGAAPETLTVQLEGDTTGPLGGFVFSDTATWSVTDTTTDTETLKAPAPEIAAYIIEHGGEVERREIEGYFEISADTLTARLYKLERDHHIRLIRGSGRGSKSRLIWDAPEPADDQLPLTQESHDPVNDDSYLSDGRSFTPTKTLDSALATESHESNDPADPQETKTPHLQGDLSYESHDSPTEREAPADAAPPSEPDDTNWWAT